MKISARKQWQVSGEAIGLVPHNGKKSSWVTDDPVRKWFFTEASLPPKDHLATSEDIFGGHN